MKKQMLKNKALATLIAIILITSMATVFLELPIASAQSVPDGMTWDLTQNPSATRLLLWNRWKDQVPTWVFLIPSPNPVGVGQTMSFVMFNPQQPQGASATNDIRYEYSIKIVKPNGDTETLPPPGGVGGSYMHSVRNGHFVSDSTGTSFTIYTPDQVGNHTATVTFHELFYKWSDTAAQRDYYGVTFKESTYTVTFTVQEEAVYPKGWAPVPLPTEYWARPIEGQNNYWYQVASNWLASAKDKNFGGSENRFQKDGIAPNSAHILWTKTTEDGGVVGGGNFSVLGEVFNAGHQYQTRFTNQIIMHGRLYYQEPVAWAGGGGRWVCVDLKTGQEVWANRTMDATPSFGYYYDWDDMNQHGIVNPGWLFSNNFGTAIHPRYGISMALNITGVPSGYEIVGPKGEHLRYVLSNQGTTPNPNWRLMQWNSSKVFTSASSGTINASLPSRFDWDVAAPWRNTMTGGSITIRGVEYGDILIGSNGTHQTGTSAPTYHYPEEVTFWALSLKPGQEGQLLWMKNIPTVLLPDNKLQIFTKASEGVIVFVQLPHLRYVGYDMYTGNKLWETSPQSDYNPFGYYTYPSLINIAGNAIAYGKLFTAGYTGMVFCYDLKTGQQLWRYEAPTNMEIFQYYTLFLGAVADGKIFVGTHEHSADTPLFKGNRIRALDVETGEEVWTLSGWGHPYTFAVADGTLIYWNNYDHQVYAIGKGPSAMTVEAPTTASTMGSSVIIRGTVTDISPGTKQHEQAMRFPNGVPAVSDESQSAWMEYVYIQKPKPIDVTGVPITLSVIDANGNYREIGTVTSDGSGFYSLSWTPDIEGKYTVYANFAGSESYWPSHAVTAFTVDSAPTTPAPTQAITPTSAADTYLLPGIIAIIVAIAIVGALMLMAIKKRP
jgi:outer membrane protein assembly factor BamB